MISQESVSAAKVITLKVWAEEDHYQSVNFKFGYVSVITWLMLVISHMQSDNF